MVTDKLFTGQRAMEDLGIYHYGARFYSPKLGRFLSADSIVPGYADPQNLNRYSYVGNSPLNYTDPTGHMRIQDGPQQDTFKPSVYNKYVPKPKPKTPKPDSPKDDKKDGGCKNCSENKPNKPGGSGGDVNNGSSCSQTGAVTACEISITPESLSSIDTLYYGAQIFDYGFYLLTGAYVGSKGGLPGILVAELFFGGTAVYESLILSDIRDDIYTAAKTNTPLVVQTADSVGLVVGNTGDDGGTWVNTPMAFVFTDILVFLNTGNLLSP